MGPIWDAFKEGIFQVLLAIEGVVGDWGLAIILLTILIRLLMWPLTIKQTKSAVEMRKYQPLLKEIQTKYADDKEKQQEELMKFYSEHKVNPFGGCLPMLLQMPIFIALYQVIGSYGGKPGLMAAYFADKGISGSFYGIIPDLAMSPKAALAGDGVMSALPYILLLAFFGLSIWLPQAMMPSTDKTQKMIGLYMGAFMLFVGWPIAGGVLLYWDTSSLVGILQQQITQKAMESADDDAEIVVEKPKSKSTKSGGAKGAASKSASKKSSK